jgi:hypothetical protein
MMAVFSAEAVTVSNRERTNAKLKQRCFMRRTYRAETAKATGSIPTASRLWFDPFSFLTMRFRKVPGNIYGKP